MPKTTYLPSELISGLRLLSLTRVRHKLSESDVRIRETHAVLDGDGHVKGFVVHSEKASVDSVYGQQGSTDHQWVFTTDLVQAADVLNDKT